MHSLPQRDFHAQQRNPADAREEPKHIFRFPRYPLLLNKHTAGRGGTTLEERDVIGDGSLSVFRDVPPLSKNERVRMTPLPSVVCSAAVASASHSLTVLSSDAEPAACRPDPDQTRMALESLQCCSSAGVPQANHAIARRRCQLLVVS